MVKNLPAMQDTWVQSLGWEDPLEKEMATHSSVLAREIPRTEKSDRLQSTGSQRVGYNLVTKQQQHKDRKRCPRLTVSNKKVAATAAAKSLQSCPTL